MAGPVGLPLRVAWPCTSGLALLRFGSASCNKCSLRGGHLQVLWTFVGEAPRGARPAAPGGPLRARSQPLGNA